MTQTDSVPPEPQEQPVVQHSHDFYIISPENNRIATLDVVEKHGVRWFTNVWTSPSYRRRGYATLLMKEALRVYGRSVVYLSVGGYTNRPLADEALSVWYRTFGFVPIEGAPGMMKREGSDVTV